MHFYTEQMTCTQCVITNFNSFVSSDTSFSEFIEKLEKLKDKYDEREDDPRDHPVPLDKMALITATTSSHQKRAEELLEQFGFNRSEPYASVKYEIVGSKVTLWHMGARDFCERLERYIDDLPRNN